MISEPNYKLDQNLNFVSLAANLHTEQYINNTNTNKYCGHMIHFV